jgi:hypothetical protein
VIFYLLGIVLWLTFLGATALRQDYTRQMPAMPQVAQGRIIPIEVNYGKTVYVSSGEKAKLNIAYGSVLVSGVVFVGFGFWSVKIKKRVVF